jgi:hypothetical protein
VPEEGRLEIIYIEGKPAVQLRDAQGRLTGAFRWATPEDLAPPEAPLSQQVGAHISKATFQEVEIRTQAIRSEVALNPGNVLAARQDVA